MKPPPSEIQGENSDFKQKATPNQKFDPGEQNIKNEQDNDEIFVKQQLEELDRSRKSGIFPIVGDVWRTLVNKAKDKGLDQELKNFLVDSFSELTDQWKEQSKQGSLDVNSVRNYLDAAQSIDAKIDSKLLKDLIQSDIESVPNQQDEALEKIENDQLGRAAFARYLVKRISGTHKNSGAYSIHLSGPWGSGKSTVMNFMRSELVKPKKVKQNKNIEDQVATQTVKWNIIDFNAWQNQHINPPWWSIYSQVFNQTKKQLGMLFRFREFFWRSVSWQLLLLFVFLILFWGFVIYFNIIDKGSNTDDWAALADNISKILALFTTAATGFVGFTRSLFSARAAKNFEEHSNDPMKIIQKRFGKLLKKLNKTSRQLIFIDDLDRCHEQYVVSLLEGIQTLFRQGGLIFIVAADKNWLDNCFEKVYGSFTNSVKEPGKSLGALFLEKAFQLSASLPSIPTEFKKNYWQQLISVKDEEVENKMNEARLKAKSKIKSDVTNENITKVLDDSKQENMLDQIALREEAVLKLATPESMERTEHVLKPFITLLDDNPRAMKRFVNAFSLNNTRSILSFLDIDKNVLAQWTIINMRWPVLAHMLADNPGLINDIYALNMQNIDKSVHKLIESEDLQNVLNGGGITQGLTLENIKDCSVLT